MNIDWIKFLTYCAGMALVVFWMTVMFLTLTGCSHTTETETDVSWCVGYCGVISQDTETTTKGKDG